MKKDEKIDKNDKKADMLTRCCINCQSAHEELAEKIEKDNEQTWKEVHKEEKMHWQLSEENKWKVDDIIWESSCSQHQRCIINAKSLQEIQD